MIAQGSAHCRVDERTDEQLYDAYRDGGDERALASLVERRWEMCYRLALGVLHDPAAAEDAAQLALVKLVSAARRRESLGAVGGWLATTVVNEARMQRRAESRREKHEEQAAAARPQESAPSSAGVSELTEALPEKLKVPLELHFGLGLTHVEVGSLLGWPVGTVSTRIREGLASLREQLAGAGVATAAVTVGTLLSAARAEAREAAVPQAPSALDLGRAAPGDAPAPLRPPSRFTLGAPLVAAAAAAVAVTGLLATGTQAPGPDARLSTAPVVTDAPRIERPPLAPPAAPRPSELLVPPAPLVPEPVLDSEKTPGPRAQPPAPATETGAAGAALAPNRRLFWKVKCGKELTLCFLGSLPLGEGDLYPLPEEIEDAYAKSDGLVVALDADSASFRALEDLLTSKGPCHGDDTIGRHVSLATLNRLEEHCTANGLRPAALERVLPWFAALGIEAAALSEQGVDPARSLERHFLDKAHEGGKTILELETPQEEVALLSKLPDDLQDDLLSRALDDASSAKERAASFREAWRTGDAEAVARLAQRGAERGAAHDNLTKLDEQLIAKRSESLAKTITRDLVEKKKKGSYFVVLDAELLLCKKGVFDCLHVESTAADEPTKKEKK